MSLALAERQRISTGYEPRRHQQIIHDSLKRFNVLVCHRRFGKTVLCINALIDAALRCKKPNPRFAYVAPLLSQSKDVAWQYLMGYGLAIPGAEANVTELRVDLPHNGARVRLYGADNPDRLRGLYLDGVVLDEYADMHPGVWSAVIRPALSDRRGWAVFIGTPKGHNEFYSVYQRGRDDPDWYAAVLRASETGVIDEGELADARRAMTPEQYEQEYECSFEAAITGAYWGRDMAVAEREGRIGEVEYDASLPVHTAWDIGVRDATAIWFFQVLHGGIHIIDHYEATGVGLPHYAETLKAKSYSYGRHFLPHDAAVQEWGTGRTRVEQMLALKLTPDMVAQHALMDGINAARMTLPKCRFNRATCDYGIEALKQYRADWDEEKRVLKPTPRHDWTSHSADAFRYLSMAWRAMKQPDPPPPPPKFEYRGIGQSGAVIQSGRTFNEMIEARTKRRKAED